MSQSVSHLCARFLPCCNSILLLIALGEQQRAPRLQAATRFMSNSNVASHTVLVTVMLNHTQCWSQCCCITKNKRSKQQGSPACNPPQPQQELQETQQSTQTSATLSEQHNTETRRKQLQKETAASPNRHLVRAKQHRNRYRKRKKPAASPNRHLVTDNVRARRHSNSRTNNTRDRAKSAAPCQSQWCDGRGRCR